MFATFFYQRSWFGVRLGHYCCRPSRTSRSREGRQTGSVPFPNQRFGEGRHGNKVHRSQRYNQWLASAMYFRNCYRSVYGVTRRVDRRWRRKSSVDPGDAPACLGPLTYRGLVNRQGSVPDDRGTEIPRTSASGETNGG